MMGILVGEGYEGLAGVMSGYGGSTNIHIKLNLISKQNDKSHHEPSLPTIAPPGYRVHVT